MVNDSLPPITKEEEKRKWQTSCDLKIVGCARQLQNITDQPMNRILHAVDNNILQNLPILQEDAGMA